MREYEYEYEYEVPEGDRLENEDGQLAPVRRMWDLSDAEFFLMEREAAVFDHERLDVYRLAIEYVGFSFPLASKLSRSHRFARSQWLRAAQSIPLNIAEGNGKESLNDKNRFLEIARGSALECAAMHDVLYVCSGLNHELNYEGKAKLRRIVSMLTRLIQRKIVSEATHGYQIATPAETDSNRSTDCCPKRFALTHLKDHTTNYTPA